MSTPLAFWKDEDIKGYVDKYNVSISKIYDMGYERTGCMFCGFGIQFQDEDGIKRFDRMKHTHPAQYNYCMNKLGLYPVFDYVGVMNKNYELDYT